MDIGNVYQYMNEIMPSYDEQAKTTFVSIKEFALLLRIYWIVDA